MRRVFTHPNSMIVGLLRGLLEREGITLLTRNEYGGGAAGELAPTDQWPELWALDEAQLALAEQLAAQFIQQLTAKEACGTWHCSLCGEENHSAFEHCWRCPGVPSFPHAG